MNDTRRKVYQDACGAYKGCVVMSNTCSTYQIYDELARYKRSKCA